MFPLLPSASHKCKAALLQLDQPAGYQFSFQGFSFQEK